MICVYEEDIHVNPFQPVHTGSEIADDNLKYNFVSDKWLVSIMVSLKYVPGGVIDNKSSLF